MPPVRPLTPLEHLLLNDQRPGYPMAFYLHCDVDGPLDPDRLEAALHAAAARHPLLRSRVSGGFWRPAWLPPDREPRLIVFRCASSATSPPPPSPWAPIDLRSASGVRLVAIERAALEWQVVLHVQHPVCDGLAGIEFFGDVWSYYHGSEPAPFRQPARIARRVAATAPSGGEPAGDDGRSTAPMTPQSPLSPATETVRFALFIPDLLARGPASPASPATPAVTPDWSGPPLPYLTVTFDREETAAIKARAVGAKVSMNDVVVAAVMRVACEWNERAGHPAAGVRITMPASLKPAGRRAPACNDMAYAFLDRSADDCQNPAALVRSLAAASRWIQEHRAVEAFLHTLSVVQRFPPLLWVLTRLPIPLSTAVVSYVGNTGPRMRANVPHDGGRALPADLRIVRFAGVPPVRPGTRLAVGIVVYDGQLSLSTLCDERVLGAAAPSLLSELIRREVLDCTAAMVAATDQSSGAGGIPPDAT